MIIEHAWIDIIINKPISVRDLRISQRDDRNIIQTLEQSFSFQFAHMKWERVLSVFCFLCLAQNDIRAFKIQLKITAIAYFEMSLWGPAANIVFYSLRRSQALVTPIAIFRKQGSTAPYTQI